MTSTLVMLHGFMGDPADWAEVRAELTGFEIVTPRIEPADDWEQGVTRLLDELPQQSVLIGYSMGARLALACAVAAPQRCEALVFVSGNPGLDTVARNSRYQHDLQVADRIEQEPRDEFLSRWYSQNVFSSLSAKMAREEIERKLSQDGSQWGDILRTYSIGQQPDFWPALDELPFPILAVAGQHDKKYVDIMVRMSQWNHCEARIIPGAGHIVHREQPFVFIQILQAFLSRVVPTQQAHG